MFFNHSTPPHIPMVPADIMVDEPERECDEILLLLRHGLNTSHSSASSLKDVACKSSQTTPPAQKQLHDCEQHCMCGGNIILSGCCAIHAIPSARTSQPEARLVEASTNATGSNEDPFVVMFRGYFGIPLTVDIAWRLWSRHSGHTFKLCLNFKLFLNFIWFILKILVPWCNKILSIKLLKTVSRVSQPQVGWNFWCCNCLSVFHLLRLKNFHTVMANEP